MIPDIPWYITLITLVTNVAVFIGTWTVLSRAAGRSGLASTTQRSVRAGVAVFLVAWLGAALLLAPAPASVVGRDPFALTPLVPLFGTIAFAVLIAVFTISPAFRQVLDAVSLPAVTGVQLYRIIGGVFLVLLAQGQVPAHFALPAGWGDLAVGLAAPLVALALAHGIHGGRALALSWNLFGLLDLAVAAGMGTGFLAPILAPDLGPRVPPVSAMGVFPLILVPLFALPVSVMLHLVALRQLRRERRIRREHLVEVTQPRGAVP